MSDDQDDSDWRAVSHPEVLDNKTFQNLRDYIELLERHLDELRAPSNIVRRI